MKAKKQTITTQDIDIDIAEITLLSTEQYEANKDIIPHIDNWWWLRSPGYDNRSAAYVNYGGSVRYIGSDVSYDIGAVRPVVVMALRLTESSITNLNVGDKIEMVGHRWTMLRGGMALCDDIVGQIAFREDWRAIDVNVYDASDVKKWLQEWADENGIEV